jgi:hypothetical protein
MKFMAADIVLTCGKPWFSKLIRWGTQHTGEEKTEVNHAGGGENEENFIEALLRVVRTKWADLIKQPSDTYQVWRCTKLTDEQREAIAAKMRDYLGRKYGWMKIVFQGIDGILGKIFFADIYLARRLACMDRYPICSWVVAFAYHRVVGLLFGVPPNEATPDDILDYIKAHPGEGWVRIV